MVYEMSVNRHFDVKDYLFLEDYLEYLELTNFNNPNNIGSAAVDVLGNNLGTQTQYGTTILLRLSQL